MATDKIGAFVEDQSVKHAVDDIAHGTGKDQRHAKDQSRVYLFLDQLAQVPANGNHGNDPENGKHRLAPLARNIEPEGHARDFQ